MSQTPPTAGLVSHRRLVVVLTVVAVVTYVLDQLTKLWAVAHLTQGRPQQLVGTFLQLQLIRNPGAAFSLGTGSTWVLTLIAIVVLVVIVRVSRRLGSRGWAWAFGLLLGGALGNLTDRLVREPGVGRGHVVDFIAYSTWFIGNVADIAIVTAAGLIALLALRGTGVDGAREGHRADPAERDQPTDQPDQSHHSDQSDQSVATTDQPTATTTDQPTPDTAPRADV